MRPTEMRLLAAALAAVLVLGSAAPASAGTGTDDTGGTTGTAVTDADEAQQAALDIAAARERANQAAEDYFAAQGELDLLEIRRGELAQQVAELELRVAELEQAVAEVAVNRYTSSGAAGIPILTDLRRPTTQLHGAVLTSIVAETGATVLDDYDAARDDLEDAREALDETEVELQDRQAELLELQAGAEAEVERLRQMEQQRLHDEAVQAALAALELEEQRQLDELRRREAEAARVAQEERAAAEAAANAAPPPTLPDDGDPNTPPVTIPVVVPVDPDALGAADDSSAAFVASGGASGGAAGGRTGAGGAGSNPRLAGVGYLDPMLCPVLGGSPPYDSWGAPRSGGRVHQGIDLLAPTGRPLVAVVSGVVSQRTNRLGGTTIALLGDNGNRYYYAHLAAYEGGGGWVPQGQVIGYVGDSGNATGIPHLHFEIHPGGGLPVNPYESIVAAGC
jgi:murein DD-endopeptidase MepM/ murein hydrolase activator NlpD